MSIASFVYVLKSDFCDYLCYQDRERPPIILGNAMEPQDCIDKFYLVLLDKGWTLNEIDSMDMMYYLKLINRKIKDERVYIDDVL